MEQIAGSCFLLFRDVIKLRLQLYDVIHFRNASTKDGGYEGSVGHVVDNYSRFHLPWDLLRAAVPQRISWRRRVGGGRVRGGGGRVRRGGDGGWLGWGK